MNWMKINIGKTIKKFEKSIQFINLNFRLNSVDFGDLILFCIKIFQKNNNVLSKYQNIFKYIHVDEYQDINPIQQKWIHFYIKAIKIYVVLVMMINQYTLGEVLMY